MSGVRWTGRGNVWGAVDGEGYHAPGRKSGR